MANRVSVLECINQTNKPKSMEMAYVAFLPCLIQFSNKLCLNQIKLVLKWCIHVLSLDFHHFGQIELVSNW